MFRPISRFLSSRLALNLYFWAFLLLMKYDDLDDQTYYSYAFYFSFMLFYLALMAGFSYVNNLILQPFLLYRKKPIAFYAVSILWIVFFSYFYAAVLLGSEALFPQLNGEDLSVLTVTIPEGFTWNNIFSLGSSYLPILFFWTIVFGMAGLNRYRTVENSRMQEALNRYRETELNLLRQQLNPHFLFNTLNNLYSLSLENSGRTSESILQLSAILRYILYESSASLVSFSKEREMMQAYIDIEMLRLEENPDIDFSISSDAERSVPPLIWLPVLENVFKHTRAIPSPHIHFLFQLRGNELSVHCRNSRVDTSLKETGGIGLENLRKRLDLLYPDNYSLEARAENGFFITDIRIKLA